MITANNNMPDTAKNPFEMSADLMGQGSAGFGNLLQGAGSLTNINDYMNPFFDQVLNSTLGRMDDNFQQQNMRLGDQAQAADAFGYGRHGVVEGALRGDYNQNVADTTANLSMQGWQDAAERAYRDQVTGSEGLMNAGNQYFGVGNQLMQNQMDQGNAQHQVMQAILNGGQQQFAQYQQHPMQMINMMNAMLQGDVRRGAGTGQQSSTPGMFDYLSLAAGLGSAALTGGASIPFLGIGAASN